jgi:hypothetical protein
VPRVRLETGRTNTASGDAENTTHNCRSAKRYDGSGDPYLVARRHRFRDLPHSGTRNAHVRCGQGKIDDGIIETHQAEARRAEPDRHGLGANDLDADRKN